ncbi:MAG TPA: RAD55 family ATPase, partial [Candidatus Bathyarchaeia archaeon]|nr:RAD55 family ATPase [Candidatus Bathyarchaeia archaeon]
SSASIIQRGQIETITATVSNALGPVNGASVTANTPSNGVLYLPQVTSSNGVYSANYQVLMNDPNGTWTLVVQAISGGNSGKSALLNVTITKANLFVDSLTTYNSRGATTTSLSPGDTIFASFRIRYSGSSATFPQTGQYVVSLNNPSGATVARLTAVYDANRLGFYTPNGYTISSADPAGTWIVAVSANSINDGFGNMGPAYTTSVNLEVVTSPLGSLPFLIGSTLAAFGAGVVAFKKYNTQTIGFEHLDEMMGGPLPRSSSVLVLGDPGSGKTILSHEFLHDELEGGRPCALISYDAFPEDVQARMREFGWDIVSDLRKGRLKIIDCYSGLAGQGEGVLRDPSDLTELNIQVTSFITKAKNAPVTIVLDSLTPIFNGVDAKQAISFLQTVSAKVKRTGGLFILTATKGAVPEDSIAKLKSIVDGVIELTLVRIGRKVVRYLSVLKMERRTIISEAFPFQIDRNHGIIFRVSRFGVLKKRMLQLRPSFPGRSEAGTAPHKGEKPHPEGRSGGSSPSKGVGAKPSQ